MVRSSRLYLDVWIGTWQGQKRKHDGKYMGSSRRWGTAGQEGGIDADSMLLVLVEHLAGR